ncbi:hypothetical protein L596_029107 [Steinernema carpocapsae]|nr:hypothetical protein L596_029107 [Steinernema carpocapsae]
MLAWEENNLLMYFSPQDDPPRAENDLPRAELSFKISNFRTIKNKYTRSIPIGENLLVGQTDCGNFQCYVINMRTKTAQVLPLQNMAPKTFAFCGTWLYYTNNENALLSMELMNLVEDSAFLQRHNPLEVPPCHLTCHSCNAILIKSCTFHCKWCAPEKGIIDLFLCGTCAINGHRTHMKHVKNAIFLSSTSKNNALSELKLDGLALNHDKQETIGQLVQQLEDCYTSLEEEYGALNAQIDQLKELPTITQNSLKAEMKS